MDKISRRKMLQHLAAGVAVMTANQLLSACQPSRKTLLQSTSIQLTDTYPPTDQPVQNQPAKSQEAATPQPEPTARTYPDMVVARNGQPEVLVRAAMDTLGGMGRFVPKGSRVIIKPNICVAYHSYEYAATTNPWVVGALVKLCMEAGAGRVQVMDYPFGGSARDAYKASGIGEQVEAVGGEMVQMSGFKYKTFTIENALSLQKTDIYEDALQADVLINVPIAKDHGMATLTMGMKNLMGLIKNRPEIHRDFGNRLTDLARTIRPTLTVIDAVRILTDHGPSGGNLDDVRQMDTVIVSQDIVAADSYGATLFGMQPDDLDYIRVGAETGLGKSDLQKLNIQELTVGG